MNNILINAVAQVLLFTLIPFIWWCVTAKKQESFFSWIGLKKPIVRESKLKVTLIIIITCVVYIALMGVIMNQILGLTTTATNQFSGKGWSALGSILIYAIVQTGLSEEILFRGFLGKRLSHKIGFTWGNTIQALLFGLLHGIPFGLVTGNVWVMILLIILPGTIGWMEGWINEKYSGGSILLSWGMHAVLNILASLSAAL